jgi:hypothetical protein
VTIDHAPAAPEPPAYWVNCAAEHCTLRVRAHGPEEVSDAVGAHLTEHPYHRPVITPISRRLQRRQQAIARHRRSLMEIPL